MTKFLRIRNITLTVIIPILSTIIANILAVCGILYSGYLDTSLTQFFITINLIIFSVFFFNFCMNVFGKEKIIKINSDRTLAIIYFIGQVFFILFLHLPMFLWALGILNV